MFDDAVWKKLKIGGKIVTKTTHFFFLDYQKGNYEIEHLPFENLGTGFLGVKINSTADFEEESKDANVYALTKNDDKKDLFELNAAEKPDQAMKANELEKGGIDLTPAKMNFQVKNDTSMVIRFHLDPGMLEKLQNAPGFVPVIINIQPMTDLKLFLGADNQAASP